MGYQLVKTKSVGCTLANLLKSLDFISYLNLMPESFFCTKIPFLVSLLFVALLNPKFNPYLLFKFLIFYHSSKLS